MIGGIKYTWAVGVVHYSAGVVNWTMEELASMDERTRKIFSYLITPNSSYCIYILVLSNIGTVASLLARSTPERALLVRALAGNIVLCSWARHFTLTVPLSTQVYCVYCSNEFSIKSQ